jgi:hypothetical protein
VRSGTWGQTSPNALRLTGRQFVTLISLVLLGACVPAVGQNQVAVRFYSPPGKNPALQQYDEAACTRAANNYVRIYVERMQRRGYRPEIVGEGGVLMTVSQLPLPSAAPVTPSSSVALRPSTEGAAVSQDEQMACTEFAAGSAAVYAECIRKRAFVNCAPFGPDTGDSRRT